MIFPCRNTFLSEDPDVWRDLIHLEKARGEGGVKVDPLTCVRTAVLAMLYADDADIVPESTEGLAKVITVIPTVFGCQASSYPKGKRRPSCCGHRIRHLTPNRSSSQQRGRCIDRLFCFRTRNVLSQTNADNKHARYHSTDTTREGMLL